MRRNSNKARKLVPAALAMAALVAGCAIHGTAYRYAPDYDCKGKTIGLGLVLDGDEQEALEERRVVRRSVSSVENEGYAGDPDTEQMAQDVGNVRAPKEISSLDETLEHSRYYDMELVHPMIKITKALLEKHGYPVIVIPVPDGEFELTELAERATSKGCDILAVETISLVRSWNIRRDYRSRALQQTSTSFRWQRQVGGLVLTNISLLDLQSGEVVWQHARREINISLIGPLTGQLYDDHLATTRFATHPGAYLGWMYLQSAKRSLNLLFATNEGTFRPLPDGSSAPDSVRQSTQYSSGQYVLVRPIPESRIWHVAQVTAADDREVHIAWQKGMWDGFTDRVTYPRSEVTPMPDPWPPIVWVRSRAKLEYTPYRFRQWDDGADLAYVTLAGEVQPRTYLTGRIGIVPE